MVHKNAVETELLFDDGQEDFVFKAPINSIGACKFDSQFKMKLTKLKIYLRGISAKIHVLDSDFESIYSKVITNLPSDQKWLIADISDANIRVEGDFYVGVEWIDPELHLGVDNKKPYFNRSYLGRLGSPGYPKLKENYMIRAFASKSCEYDAFVAYYQRTGSDFAEHLKIGMSEQRFNVFLDVIDIPKSIQPETTRWRAIRDRALQNSGKFILIMTKGFNTREEILYELKLAMHYGVERVHCKHKDLDKSDLIVKIDQKSTDLSESQYVEFSNGPDLLRKILKMMYLQKEVLKDRRLRASDVEFILQKFQETVEKPVRSNWSIRILHPNKHIEKCIVFYDRVRLPWWDKNFPYYERTIVASGGGNVRIPVELEKDEAEVEVMDGKKTLRIEKFKDIVESNPKDEVEYIEGISAILFFPKGTPEKHKNLAYHRRHLHHRLIVNHKTKLPKAYYMTPASFGWRFIKSYPIFWVSEIVDSPNYEIDDPNFTEKWCRRQKYKLIKRTATKKDLLEAD